MRYVDTARCCAIFESCDFLLSVDAQAIRLRSQTLRFANCSRRIEAVDHPLRCKKPSSAAKFFPQLSSSLHRSEEVCCYDKGQDMGFTTDSTIRACPRRCVHDGVISVVYFVPVTQSRMQKSSLRSGVYPKNAALRPTATPLPCAPPVSLFL